MRCESGSNSAYPDWVRLKILGSVTIWETGPKGTSEASKALQSRSAEVGEGLKKREKNNLTGTATFQNK